MRNRLFWSTVVLFAFLLSLNLPARPAWATSRVFVVDASASMRKAGLFDRIKRTIKEDYVPQLKTGDHIIVLTFDEKVNILLDQAVLGSSDLPSIAATIDRLEAHGPWTWLTKALEVANQQAARLKAQYPSEPLFIYLLTDGINDPPPILREPMLRFVEVLSQHFGKFNMEGAYVYVLVFRGADEAPALSRAESDVLSSSSGGRVLVATNTPGSLTPIPPEIYIGYADTDLGTLDLVSGEVTRTVTLVVKDVVGETRGKEVRLSCYWGSFPAYREFKVEPAVISVERVGQVEKPVIHIPSDLPTGEYGATLRLSSPGVLMTPGSVALRFRAARVASSADRSPRALLSLLLLPSAYGAYLLARRKTIVVREQDGERRLNLVVRGLKSASLEGIGLTHYSVVLGRYPQHLRSLFLVRSGTSAGKIELGKPIPCDSREGTRIIVIEKPDRPTSTKQTEPLQTPPKSPDFFAESHASEDPDEHFRSDIDAKE